jgi:uncharacterized membrane protein YphA (DoxX/SURF4 family)
LSIGIAVLAGILILAGLLTPLTAAVIGVGAFTSNLVFVQALFVGVVALALALLGPGALSIDARLFGRREIIIPHVSRRYHDGGSS